MGTYLVTGGAGFIGSHLVDGLLGAGHKIVVLDDLSTGKIENIPAGVRLIRGSVTDGPLVREAMSVCDGCFHLAAIASVERCNDEWVATHMVNMTGAITILDAAARYKLPVVYASTAAVYGNAKDFPIREKSSMQPLSAYGADKRGIELHAQVGWSVHGVPSVGLRFFNVYGPRQNPHSPYSGVISIFADCIARGGGITIFGDGEQTRDFVYVGDVVEALMRAMGSNPRGAEIFNVCTGIETSLLELADTLGQILDIRPQISFGPARPGDIARSVGDPGRLKEKMEFKPSITLTEGLSTFVFTGPQKNLQLIFL